MRQLPKEKVPKIDSDGEKYRELQLNYQLPKQDLALKHCQHIESQHSVSFQDFIEARNDIALDVAHPLDGIPEKSPCYKCEKILPGGSLAVLAPRFGLNTFWHPACFTCHACEEMLVRRQTYLFHFYYCTHEDTLKLI